MFISDRLLTDLSGWLYSVTRFRGARHPPSIPACLGQLPSPLRAAGFVCLDLCYPFDRVVPEARSQTILTNGGTCSCFPPARAMGSWPFCRLRTCRSLACTTPSMIHLVSSKGAHSFSDGADSVLKEPRFLVPLVMPLSVLFPVFKFESGHSVSRSNGVSSPVQSKARRFSKRKIKKKPTRGQWGEMAQKVKPWAWVTFNVALLLFFGYLHQAGTISSLVSLSSSLPRCHDARPSSTNELKGKSDPSTTIREMPPTSFITAPICPLVIFFSTVRVGLGSREMLSIIHRW